MCGSLNLPFVDERHLNSQMGNPMGYFSGKLEIMEHCIVDLSGDLKIGRLTGHKLIRHTPKIEDFYS